MQVTKAAIYTRVSTKKQNTDRQVAELKYYATKLGMEVVLIVSETITGSISKEKRPGLEQIFELARKGQIQAVISLELSRLGRNAMDVRQIILELNELGVCTHIVNRGLRSLDKQGKKDSLVMLILGLLADLAEMEKETLVERINSGLEEAKRKGKKLGRPKGSSFSQQRLLQQHPGIVKDLGEGLSIRRTAAFRKVSVDTVQRVKKALFETA